MAIGTVKFFNAEKGFGFIVPEGGGKDIFVHKSAIELANIPPLIVGQILSFETESNKRGAIQAAKLEVLFNDNKPVFTNRNLPISLHKQSLQRITNGNPNRKTWRDAPKAAQKSDLLESQRMQKAPAKSSDWKRSYDRYCDLARLANDDPVMRENYWQHAEHFLRMMNGSVV